MDIGGFIFELPVWVARIEAEGERGIAVCQVEGQDCLVIFTEEELIERYFAKRSGSGKVFPVPLNSPESLATVLQGSLNTALAAHIAIDPNGKTFVWPINETLRLLRKNGGK